MTCVGKKTTIADSSGNIVNVSNIGDFSFSRASNEDTTYGPDEWQTFCPGLINGGTVDIVLNYDSTDASHNRFISNFLAGISDTYTITFPDATSLVFSGFVQTVGGTQPVGTLVQRTFTVVVDGKTVPVFSELTP